MNKSGPFYYANKQNPFYYEYAKEYENIAATELSRKAIEYIKTLPTDKQTRIRGAMAALPPYVGQVMEATDEWLLPEREQMQELVGRENVGLGESVIAQAYLAWEEIEFIKSLKEAEESLARGEGIPAEEFFAKLREKYGL